MAYVVEDKDLTVLTTKRFLRMSHGAGHLMGEIELQIKNGGTTPTYNVCLTVYVGQSLSKETFTAPELLGQVKMSGLNDWRKVWIVLERGGELIVRHHLGTHGNQRIIARGRLAS